MKNKTLIDEKLYTVTTINGYRQGGFTMEQAVKHANNLHKQMENAGWRGDIRVHYRDGTCVLEMSVPRKKYTS